MPAYARARRALAKTRSSSWPIESDMPVLIILAGSRGTPNKIYRRPVTGRWPVRLGRRVL